jgi:hypothetical protein
MIKSGGIPVQAGIRWSFYAAAGSKLDSGFNGWCWQKKLSDLLNGLNMQRLQC